MTAAYLIRHAASEFQRHAPEPEWPLNEQGALQAEWLVPFLKPLGIEAIYSSPYIRAVATVQPFATQHGLDIRVDERLAERRLAPEPLDEFLEVLKRTWEDLDFALAGGESSRRCQTRIIESVTDITDRHDGETVAISSHGNAIGLFLQHLDSEFGFEDWLRMRNPDVFRIHKTPAGLTWDKTFTFTL